jgi:hypothetical protein
LVGGGFLTSPSSTNARRRSYERLLRKLLRYKHEPAVVLMNLYLWQKMKGYEWNFEPKVKIQEVWCPSGRSGAACMLTPASSLLA